MLKLMRQHATSWFIKILLGAIVIVFVFFGVGSFQEQRKTKAAIVNGDLITMAEYLKTHKMLIDNYRQSYGDRFNNELIKMLNIEEQAVNSLIERELMTQQAHKLGLKVSTEELSNVIWKFKAFHKNGIFDKERYMQILQRNRMTPEEFEFSQRNSLLGEKLHQLIVGNAKLTNEEVLKYYQWQNTTVSIDYALFKSSTYKNIKPSEEEIKTYFEKNKDNYKTQPTIKAHYVHFDIDQYTDSIEITDEEVSDYYEENKDEFKQEKTVEARHILFKVEPEGDDKVTAAQKKKALEILAKARKGDDFAKLAKQYSEGPSKDKGGSLGAFKKDAMVKPFADKAFAMNAGEISEPVLTKFGWHLIKVEKINPASEKKLDQVQDSIKKKLAKERAKDETRLAAENFSDDLTKGDDLAGIALTKKLEPVTTEFFTKSEGPNSITRRQKFAYEAFKLELMVPSSPIDLDDKFYVVQVIEKKPKKPEKFENIKEQVHSDYIKKEQEIRAEKDANDFLSALKKGESVQTTADKYKTTFQRSKFFKRTGSIPDIGYERAVTAAAYQLTEKAKFTDHAIKTQKGFYAIALGEKKEPDPEEFEKEKKQVQDKLLQQKRTHLFQNWLQEVKTNSQIQKFVGDPDQNKEEI